MQVKALYVLPRDGVDHRLDENGKISSVLEVANAWLAAQTGGRRVRLDRSQGSLDVQFVRLDRDEAAYARGGPSTFHALENDLAQAGLSAPNKHYLVFYDGSADANACGQGDMPGPLAFLYLRCPVPHPDTVSDTVGTTGSSTPPYWSMAALHEIFHGLGVDHVSDSPSDLMYAGPELYQPSVLDVGRDNYWTAGPSDAARSPFIE